MHFSLNILVSWWTCFDSERTVSGQDPSSLVNVRSSQLKLQVDNANDNKININVISSRNNVTISVQNSVVSPEIASRSPLSADCTIADLLWLLVGIQIRASQTFSSEHK